jgi:hypothetical protein
VDPEYFFFYVFDYFKIFIDFINWYEGENVLSGHYLFLELIVEGHPAPQQNRAVDHTKCDHYPKVYSIVLLQVALHCIDQYGFYLSPVGLHEHSIVFYVTS